MAYCSECGKPLKDGAKFCTSCGAEVEYEEESGSNREIKYQGEIHKCPNCGAVLKSFLAVCPDCGFEFRNSKVSNAIKEFSNQLKQIENEIDQQHNSNAPIQPKRIKLFYDKKIELIRNFSVPNTKEDVLEFLILASSNINYSVMGAKDWMDSGMQPEEYSAKLQLSEAWVAKFQQVYDKASISLGDDFSYKKIQSIYHNTINKLEESKKTKKRIKFDGLAGLGIMLVVLVILYIAVWIAVSSSEKKEKADNEAKENQLQATVKEIKDDIINGDYDSALIKTYTIHYDGTSDDSKEFWDEQRESLIHLIEEKKSGK